MALTNVKVQFYKGAESLYDASTYAGGIYFATDKPHIWVDGSCYGGGDSSTVEIKSFEYNDASHALDITFTDDTVKTAIIPIAADASYGLMSNDDYEKLRKISLSWFEPLEDHDEDKLAWRTDISAFITAADASAIVESILEDKDYATSEDISILDASKLDKAAVDSSTVEIKDGKVQVKISDASGNALKVDDNGGLLVDISISGGITGVKEGDHILGVEGTEIKSGLSIAYNDKKIQLVGIDGSVFSEFDASMFIKDGFLKGTAIGKADASGSLNVSIKGETKSFTDLTPNHEYLIFCFTDGRDPETLDWEAIDVNELVDEYTAGDHIEIVDHVIKVVDMSANVTKTTEDIIIAGGPLDSSAARALYPDGTIPAGTDMQALLTKLFCKVIDGTVSASYSWSPAMNKPTVSLEHDGGVVECGQSLIRNTALNNTGSGNTAKVTVTATQGYFKDEDTSYHSGNYTENVNGTFDWTENSLTTKWNSGSLLPGESSVIASLGQNKLEVSQSGATASVGEFTDAIIYASTNTKDKLDASVSIDIDKYSATSPKTLATTSVTKTVTGVYPIFYGLNTAATKATLADSTVFNDLQIVESGEDRASFSYPAGRTISVSVLNTLNNTYEPYAGDFEITDETRTINGTEYNYKLWKRVAGGNNGSNKYQITLSKKTSVE